MQPYFEAIIILLQFSRKLFHLLSYGHILGHLVLLLVLVSLELVGTYLVFEVFPFQAFHVGQQIKTLLLEVFDALILIHLGQLRDKLAIRLLHLALCSNVREATSRSLNGAARVWWDKGYECMRVAALQLHCDQRGLEEPSGS